jgi:hypothetical protein
MGTSDLITKFLRTKGTLDDLNMNFKRLFDRTLYELDHPIHDCTVKAILQKYKPKSDMRMAVRDDHAGEREIFVTSLPAICALNVIENLSHFVCEQLPSEHITLGGDKKVLIMQSEAQSSLDIEDRGWFNYLGSEDASKWSTGDNPDIVKKIWSGINHSVDDEVKLIIDDYFDSLKSRTVLFSEGVTNYIKSRVGKESLKLSMGWPQGFFNKISSLKHYLCYCLAIAMFKKAYSEDYLVRVKFAVHSDDSRHRVSFLTTKRAYSNLSYSLFLKCLYWAKKKMLIRPNVKKSFYGGIVSEYLSNFQFHGSLFIPKSKFILNIFGDLTGSGYPSDIYSVMERIRTTLRMNVGSSIGRFLMSYANHYVLRLYSMLPGMRNHDNLRNTRTNLIELGGIFSCHPIYLLFLGCKAHDILNYNSNKVAISKLINVANEVEDLDENSPSEIYNHFLPIPVAVSPEKGLIRHVRRRFSYYRLSQEEKWMPLYINDLDVQNSSKVARSLLYTNSMAKAYSTAPEGLMYSRIQQTWDKPAYRFSDQFLTFWEFVRKVESAEAVESNIFYDLIRASPTLLSIFNLEHMKDIHIGDPSRAHVTSSVVNRINVLSPGGNEYRYLKYALANLAKLPVNIPDFVDEKRLKSETDLLEREIECIPGVSEKNLIMDMQKVYKYLNVRNAKPSYLHLNKHIYSPSTLDMYELVSVVLKQYSPSVVGKVSLGKLSSVYIGERSFRPENISYKVNRDDEIHTCAKVLSIAKSNLSPTEYSNFKQDLKIGGKLVPILVGIHPFTSPHVSYYLDYLFICKEYSLPVNSECNIYEQEMDDLLIIRSGNNCATVSETEICIHNQIDNDENFLVLLALCYLRKYQAMLDSRDNWEDIEMPKQLITISPHLYLEFEKSNKSTPALAYHNGKIVFKSGYYNKYLDGIVLKKLSDDILYCESEFVDRSMNFKPEIEFSELDLTLRDGPNSVKKRLGIGVSWEGLNTYSVGELAKFTCSLDCSDFPLMGSNARLLFVNRYFATDELMLLKQGVAIPDVSRHKRFTPHLNISDLSKSDFRDLVILTEYLTNHEGIKQDMLKKSLYYKEDVEPEKNVFAFFSRSRLYSSQFKNILSYKAYTVLCQNLQPIRCRIEHEKTLSVLKGKIQTIFCSKVSSLRPSKYNLVDVVLHLSALIGINQEVDICVEGDLSGTEMLEFIKFRSYSGCTANVWNRMFNLYMVEEAIDEDDLPE